MSNPDPEDQDQLWSEATLWFARMRSPDAERFRPEFEEWLARGALHRRYYNRAAEYWVDSGTALADPDRQTATDGLDEPLAGRRSKRRPVAVLAAASVLVAGSALVLATLSRDRGRLAEPPIAAQAPAETAQYATTGGERRAVRLADGSLVTMAGGTRLRVDLGSAMRRLELDLGTARFDVAHEGRPFVVLAGGGTITAHGTMFDVKLSPAHLVSVRLIRGSVDVAFPKPARANAQPAPRRLQPGQVVSFTAADPKPAAAIATVPQAGQQSARDYRDARLADIVREANRHAAVPIRIEDSATAAQMVSGRFGTDDTALLAERLAALFDLVVDRSNPAEIVLRPK